MTNESVRYAVPAVTLGYHICNDPDGQFKFYKNDLEIVRRNGEWIATSDNDETRFYIHLNAALIIECWRLDE